MTKASRFRPTIARIKPRITLQRRQASAVAQAPELGVCFQDAEVARFLRDTSQMMRPLLFRHGPSLEPTSFPASTRWFSRPSPASLQSLDPCMSQFFDAGFPYELMLPQQSLTDFHQWLLERATTRDLQLARILEMSIPRLGQGSQKAAEQVQGRQFFNFYAPLGLLISALDFNHHAPTPLKELYIAQASLSDLPLDLQQDVPTPMLVRNAGRGDIYNSSIWLGLEPTYTPLHRDPNPNLFCQLCSEKVVRLLPPDAGVALYARVQRQIRGTGSSRIRHAEMMEGQERELLYDAVWNDPISTETVQLVEAHLRPGDGLFIPLGWWHTVKSRYSDGRLNGSVNWWFR